MSLLAVFSYYYRTGCSITDPTPTTPTGLGNPPQEQPYCHPCLKEGTGKLPQGRDCGFTTQQRKSPITYVKTCVPLETIKGEPGLTTKTGSSTQQIHHNSKRVHSQSSNQHSAHHTQSRDLGLSPLSQPTGCILLGTIKRDTQIRIIKIAKDKANHPQSPERGPGSSDSSASGPKHGSPDPFGLGRKFHLARPL